MGSPSMDREQRYNIYRDTLTYQDAQGHCVYTCIRHQRSRVSVRKGKDAHRGAAHPQLAFLSTSHQSPPTLPPPPCSLTGTQVCCLRCLIPSPLSLVVVLCNVQRMSLEMGWGVLCMVDPYGRVNTHAPGASGMPLLLLLPTISLYWAGN